MEGFSSATTVHKKESRSTIKNTFTGIWLLKQFSKVSFFCYIKAMLKKCLFQVLISDGG